MQVDEVAIISTANKTMAGGAATGLVGLWSQINWIGVGGFLIAVMGLAGNLYFQLRRDKRERDRDRRERAEHEARMAALRARLPQHISPHDIGAPSS